MAQSPNYAHISEPLHIMVDYEGPRAGRDDALTSAPARGGEAGLWGREGGGAWLETTRRCRA